MINPVGTIIATLIAFLASQALAYLQENWPAIKEWFSNLPQRILEAIGNLANTLVTKGKELLDGLKNGATNKWNDVKA